MKNRMLLLWKTVAELRPNFIPTLFDSPLLAINILTLIMCTLSPIDCPFWFYRMKLAIFCNYCIVNKPHEMPHLLSFVLYLLKKKYIAQLLS